MKIIRKFTLSVGRTEIGLPKGSDVLSVQYQYEKITLWVLVPDDTLMEDRTFLVVGTGHTIHIEVSLLFIDTIQSNDGHFVLHIFEELS